MFTDLTHHSLDQMHWYFLTRKHAFVAFEAHQFHIAILEQTIKRRMESSNAGARNLEQDNRPSPWSDRLPLD